jgi:hypothetical protein
MNLELRGRWICLALFLLSPALQGTCPEGLTALSKQDYAAALKEFTTSAEQGDACSQFNLAAMYDRGQGVPQDYQEALKWDLLAAGQGHAEAQRSLGVRYADAQGVRRDYSEALKWFRLAADQGVAEAQFNLGFLFLNGRGVPRDYNEALKWFRLAASYGYMEAQYTVGVIYHNGQGVPRDWRPQSGGSWPRTKEIQRRRRAWGTSMSRVAASWRIMYKPICGTAWSSLSTLATLTQCAVVKLSRRK